MISGSTSRRCDRRGSWNNRSGSWNNRDNRNRSGSYNRDKRGRSNSYNRDKGGDRGRSSSWDRNKRAATPRNGNDTFTQIHIACMATQDIAIAGTKMRAAAAQTNLCHRRWFCCNARDFSCVAT